MVAVPTAAPVTRPVDDTLATCGALLVQLTALPVDRVAPRVVYGGGQLDRPAHRDRSSGMA